MSEAGSWQIVLSSGSLLHDGFEAFFRDKLVPLAASDRGHGVITSRAFLTVKSQSKVPFLSFGSAPPERKRAKKAIELIRSEEGETVSVHQMPGSADERSEVLAFVSAHRRRGPLCVVTQDAGEARAVLGLSKGVPHTVAAVRLTEWGEAISWKSSANAKPSKGAPKKPAERTAFDEGSVVVGADGARHRLASYLSRGGEGTIFKTDSGKVCKVYHKDRRTAQLREKLELMVSMQLRHPAICWPEEVVCDSKGDFVGYLMPQASGHELQTSVFIKPRLESTFPGWTREHLVTLAQTILDAVAFLHEKGVLIGDINGRNILVEDEKTVYLVDADSYQVGPHRCSVGIPHFLAPELQGKDLKSVTREPRHEHFAVATLVFMLMMPGKPPFAYAGGTNPAENVKNRHFPYNLGGVKKGEKVPRGPWIYIWSNLPRTLKENFHQVFTDGDRLNIDAWQEAMRKYAYELDQGYVNDEIFPTELKRLSQRQAQRQGLPWVACTACGRGYAERRGHTTPGRCPNCRFKEQRQRSARVEVRCDWCRTPYAETKSVVDSHRAKGHDMFCKSCRTRTQSITCKNCFRTFELSVGQQLFYRRKGFNLPRSCKPCRESRKTSRSYRY